MSIVKQILKEYPDTGSIYDTGEYYVLTAGDISTLLKHDLTFVRHIPTYDEELAEICKNAIPVWPSDLYDEE